MKAYLKYYFSLIGEELNLDSVSCLEGQEPPMPENFLKWYEDGDIDFTPVVDFNEIAKGTTNPVFWAMFSPRNVTFDVDKYRKSGTV